MYKELRKQIKDIENGDSELTKSFEGEYFASSPWFLSTLDFAGFDDIEAPAEFEEIVEQTVSPAPAPTPIEAEPAPEMAVETPVEEVKEEVAQAPAETKKEIKDSSNDEGKPNFDAAYEALGPGFVKKKKAHTGKLELDNKPVTSLEEYISALTQADTSTSEFESLKASCEKGIEAIFVGESNIEDLSKLDGQHLKTEQTPDLLGKMISAMKLSSGQFVRSSFVQFDGSSEESKQKSLENICNEILLFKPKVVVTLGAVSTNLLLGKKERLSQVHGEFYTRQFCFADGEDHEFKMVPIFHPDFLEINPSMKRTAWLDLQKVMEFLNIPLK